MKNSWTFFVLTAMLAFAPCAGAGEAMMVKNPRPEATPEPGKALVVFVRSSIVAGAYSAPVIDLDAKAADGKTEDKVIGILSSFSKVAYQAEPGEHSFLAVAAGGGPGHLARAKLLAGKTYYVLVRPNWGFSPSFSLIPILNDPKAEFHLESSDLAGWLKSTEFHDPTQFAQGWLNGNLASVTAKKAAALEKWKSLPEEEQRKLTLLETDAK